MTIRSSGTGGDRRWVDEAARLTTQVARLIVLLVSLAAAGAAAGISIAAVGSAEPPRIYLSSGSIR